MPAELYWKSVFPNTPMPKSLQELLCPEKKSNFVEVKDGIDNENLYKFYCWYGSHGDSNPPSNEFRNGSHLTSNASTFFFENHLHQGRLMNLPGFTKTENQATFLSHAVADSMPFSSNKFSDILKFFSMEPKSVGAKAMKLTFENCERATIEGEDKNCATSLESLVDLTVLRLGEKIKVMSNEVEKETETGEFTIGKGVKNITWERQK
ncbi:hypothetical protein SLA2020_241930 [Shorea laevis]